MSNPIRIGIIGLGRAGYAMHSRELASRKEKFTFVAACDIIEERATSFAAEFGTKAYTNIEDLINDPEVEVVDIATRSCDHYAHAKMALLAGKSALEPDATHIQCGVQTVLFALLHDTVAASCGRIRQLQLNRNSAGNVHISHFLGFQNLKHNNVTVSHRTVINHVVLPHQRTSFILQYFLISHDGTS